MSNFKRPHHQKIEKLLQSINPDVLTHTECFFGGGTSISLMLGEFRESVDVDFMCSSIEGYRYLRNIGNFDKDLGELFQTDVSYLRPVRRDQYGIRTVIEVDGTPIKFEIVCEGRISISGTKHDFFGIPTLDRESLFAEKILANTDRWADKSVLSRDIIDLAMMIKNWGDIPQQVWDKCFSVYGKSIYQSWDGAIEQISETNYRKKCFSDLDIDPATKIIKTLRSVQIPPYEKYNFLLNR